MVNQWVYEVYTLHHKQKLAREAETSRIIQRLKSDSQETGHQLNWLTTILRDLFSAWNFWNQAQTKELSKEKRALLQDEMMEDTIADI